MNSDSPRWSERSWFPELIALLDAEPWRLPVHKDLLSQVGGAIWHPTLESWAPGGLAPERLRLLDAELPLSVVETSTRVLYSLTWRVFAD